VALVNAVSVLVIFSAASHVHRRGSLGIVSAALAADANASAVLSTALVSFVLTTSDATLCSPKFVCTMKL
jgi:hypothetical protein